MSSAALLVVLGLAGGSAWLADWRLRLAARLEEPSGAETGDAREIAPGPSRAEHIEAVQALCVSSEPYVAARLTPFEAEVSDLAELVLELDDQAPAPGPYED